MELRGHCRYTGDLRKSYTNYNSACHLRVDSFEATSGLRKSLRPEGHREVAVGSLFLYGRQFWVHQTLLHISRLSPKNPKNAKKGGSVTRTFGKNPKKGYFPFKRGIKGVFGV